jgi:carbon storage regulator
VGQNDAPPSATVWLVRSVAADNSWRFSRQIANICSLPAVSSFIWSGGTEFARNVLVWVINGHAKRIGPAWCAGAMGRGASNKAMEDAMMLVLSRKEGEQIVLGGDIVVEVLHIGKQRVRLGIAAPAATQILRKEITLPHRLRPEGNRPGAMTTPRNGRRPTAVPHGPHRMVTKPATSHWRSGHHA